MSEVGRGRGNALRTTVVVGAIVVVGLSIALFVGSSPPGTTDAGSSQAVDLEERSSSGGDPASLVAATRSRGELDPRDRAESNLRVEEEGAPDLAYDVGWGTIAGTVVSHDGKPISGVRVSGVIRSEILSSDRDREADAEAAVTDEAGAFRV